MVKNRAKDKLLSKIISDLSANSLGYEDTEKISVTVNDLKELYKDGYRHLYSTIFSSISNNSEEKNSILGQNIRQIHEYIENKKYNSDISNAVYKLYDHINLELSRLTYLSGKINQIEYEKQSLNAQLTEVRSQFNTLNEKISKLQNEYTVILGIFSAIVITFVSGLIFSSSVLQNIEKSSIYRLVLCLWLIGFILINILNAMFHFVSSLLNKAGCNNKINIKYINILFFIGLLLIFVFWFVDITRLRNWIILNYAFY